VTYREVMAILSRILSGHPYKTSRGVLQARGRKFFLDNAPITDDLAYEIIDTET
jgi:hypothetical protein